MRLLTLFFVLTVLAAGLSGPVTGQQTNATATPSPTPEPGGTVAIQIDETTALTTWEYENGTWVLTFDAELPKRLVITDSARAMEAWQNAEGKTAADLNPERYTLNSGETTITYPGTTFQGQSAITVATNQGMRFLATDGIQSGGPWSNTSPTAGWLGGLSVVGTMVGLAAYRAKNRDPGGPEDLK